MHKYRHPKQMDKRAGLRRSMGRRFEGEYLTEFIYFKTEKLTKTHWIVAQSSRWTVDVCTHGTDSFFFLQQLIDRHKIFRATVDFLI